MHLRHLVAQLHDLPPPVDTSPALVAFVMGFDHSTRGRFLADFGPWCHERIGENADMHWSATIRDNAP